MDRKLAQPLPIPFDWNENIKWISACVTALIGYIYYINIYFKNRAKEKENFIQEVVKATLRETLDGELQGIKDSIKVLFKYREDDRTHSDSQFKELLREIKK